jgi:hypothetical protein
VIRHTDGRVEAGSPLPVTQSAAVRYMEPSRFRPEIAEWVDSGLYAGGTGLTFLGPPLSGKTTGLMQASFLLYRSDPEVAQGYWAEADFLADTRTVWKYDKFLEKSSRDDSLHIEAAHWERSYVDLRERSVLMLDDVWHSYTKMASYEVESLLRSRRDRGLSTLCAVHSAHQLDLPESVRGLILDESIVVNLRGRGGEG